MLRLLEVAYTFLIDEIIIFYHSDTETVAVLAKDEY